MTPTTNTTCAPEGTARTFGSQVSPAVPLRKTSNTDAEGLWAGCTTCSYGSEPPESDTRIPLPEAANWENATTTNKRVMPRTETRETASRIAPPIWKGVYNGSDLCF